MTAKEIRDTFQIEVAHFRALREKLLSEPGPGPHIYRIPDDQIFHRAILAEIAAQIAESNAISSRIAASLESLDQNSLVTAK